MQSRGVGSWLSEVPSGKENGPTHCTVENNTRRFMHLYPAGRA